MLVGFDSTILNYLLNPKARAPKNGMLAYAMAMENPSRVAALEPDLEAFRATNLYRNRTFFI